MVKLISTFGLKPGYDPDEIYQLWIKEHSLYKKDGVPRINWIYHWRSNS